MICFRTNLAIKTPEILSQNLSIAHTIVSTLIVLHLAVTITLMFYIYLRLLLNIDNRVIEIIFS